MKVELITAYFKEEFLVPLFMLHYDWVDTMTFITQRRDDHKFDDEDKQRWINEAIAHSKSDWVVLVDMDEFIYPAPYGCNPRVVLEQEMNSSNKLIYSRMTRMWRHKDDHDIIRHRHPVPQRLHGQPDHRKPCVFKPVPSTWVGAGNHDIHCNEFLREGKEWAGAHWANADPCFWIPRETEHRGPRLTDRNKACGHGTHTLRTINQIMMECAAHSEDPQIIVLP